MSPPMFPGVPGMEEQDPEDLFFPPQVDNPVSPEALGLITPRDPIADRLDEQARAEEMRALDLYPTPPTPAVETATPMHYPGGRRVRSTRPGWLAGPPLGRIRFSLDRVARQRRIVVAIAGPNRGKVNVSALSRATQISVSSLSQMVRDPEKVSMISIDSLTRICDALNCKPGDLFEYTPPAQPITLNEGLSRG